MSKSCNTAVVFSHMLATLRLQKLSFALVALCLAGFVTPAKAATNAVVHGIATDFFVPADYDGDGKTDVAIWRPGATGVASFQVIRSSNQATQTFTFGQSGDDPKIVGDYDGDGKADPAVYRAGATTGATSSWMYLSSAAAYSLVTVTWGQNGDFPAPGDYDGDHKYDFVVQRNAGGGNANFLMSFSSGGKETNTFGTPTDSIVPGDYDGDGKTDIATVRGSGGSFVWSIKFRTGLAQTNIFGNSSTDFKVQGDYNGDGKTDLAVWRAPGLFLVHFSTNAPPSTNIDLQFSWGQNGDYPVANFNTH